jgi:saccharopine dehydrogenase (NAD+, L-lysine-forming)
MSLLVYGAYGYTGRLISERAATRGLDLVLAGRSADAVARMGRRLEAEARVVGLDDAHGLAEALDGVDCVVHCAGPFVHTARPMVDACLRTGTHYLDITGEIDVLEALAGRGDEARAAGVMVLPAVGFDVVPTDCLARHLAERLPSATSLEIAFTGTGRASRGTLKTTVEQMGRGGAVRRQGRVVQVPTGWTTRTVDFGAGGPGARTVVSIPWGDVSTAYRSTGIPNVTVYTYLPPTARRLLRWSRYIQPLLSWEPLKRLLKLWIDQQPPGPTKEERQNGSTHVWARVTDPDGGRAVARLTGPEAYAFTAQTAVAAAERVLDGKATPGYQTPASAFGADFVLEATPARREDVARPEG